MKKSVTILGILLFLYSAANCQQQEAAKDTLKPGRNAIVKVKDDANPVLFIDGKKYDSDILEIIDQSKIKKMEVFKGEMAKEKYNAESVIVITTNAVAESDTPGVVIRKGYVDSSSKTERPVIIIDGKICDKEAFEKISPDNILFVEVLKDEKSLEKYHTTVGVIIVKTKKRE